MVTHSCDRLHVGGLSWETDEGDLRRAFERYGTLVAVSVIRDPGSGRPVGHGFVTFAHPANASEARDAMAHTVLDGSTIRVTEARMEPLDIEGG